jgi:hypothetical protein
MAKWNKVLDKTLTVFAEQHGLSPNPDNDALFLMHNTIPMSIHYHFSYFNFFGAVGVLISAFSGAKGNSGILIEVPLEANQWEKEKAAALKQAFKKTGTVGFLKKKNILFINIAISSFNKSSTLDRLNLAVNILGEQIPLLGLKIRQDCFYCKQPGCDDFVEEGLVFYPTHTRCKKEQAYQLAQEIEDNILKGNYVPAFFASLIGGIIGSIPSLIMLTFFNYLIFLFFALIPIGAYFGYKIAKGIMSKVMPVIIAIVSVLCTIMLVSANIYYQLFIEWDTFLPLSEFIMILLLPDNASIVIPQFLQALFFTGVGFLASWGIIRKNNKEKLAKVKALHGNLDDKETQEPEQDL